MRHYVKNLAAAILFATATASAQPINDDFADRIRVIGLQLRLSGNNLGATSESGEPVPFYPAGHRSVWWEWTAPVSSTVHMNTDSVALGGCCCRVGNAGIASLDGFHSHTGIEGSHTWR